MVHRRELDGREIVFGVQGALWGNAMTWWDHDTGSIWSQPLGEAIAGPRKGATIELLPSTLTTWDSWRSSHPATLAMDVPAGGSGFALEDMVIVVELADDPAAFSIEALQQGVVANDVVGGAPIAVVVDPADPNRWRVFSRTLDDRIVQLAVEGGEIVDVDTRSTWDPARGIAIDGPLQGEILDPLPGTTAFPDDYATFWPEGRLWP